MNVEKTFFLLQWTYFSLVPTTIIKIDQVIIIWWYFYFTKYNLMTVWTTGVSVWTTVVSVWTTVVSVWTTVVSNLYFQFKPYYFSHIQVILIKPWVENSTTPKPGLVFLTAELPISCYKMSYGLVQKKYCQVIFA